MELHENIKALRTSRGWSQQHLADLAGYGDRSSIAKIESGKVDLPRSKIAEFARIFGVTPAYLMGYSDDTLALLDAIVEENKTGRPAALDEIRRLFGTEHSTLSTYICDDNKKLSVLYYKAVDRYVAPPLTEIIRSVDCLDARQAEQIHACRTRLSEGGAADPRYRRYCPSPLHARGRGFLRVQPQCRIIYVDFRK